MNRCEKRSEKLPRLGVDRPITRRDFIDGIAVAASVAALPRLLTAGGAEPTASAPQDRPEREADGAGDVASGVCVAGAGIDYGDVGKSGSEING